MKVRTSLGLCGECLDLESNDGGCACSVDMEVCEICQNGPLNDGERFCGECTMERVKVTGSTVRDYRDVVQVALFTEDNKYAGIFLMDRENAGKLARKLLKKSEEK